MWNREEEDRKKGRKERNKSACPGRGLRGATNPPPPPPNDPHQFPTEVLGGDEKYLLVPFHNNHPIFSVIWSWLMYHSPKFLWSSPFSSLVIISPLK